MSESLTCESCGRYLPCRHCPPPHGIRGLARTSGAGEQLSADDVLVTLRMREFKDGDGRTYYVSAVNEYSCLSIDARLPEIVSVTPALGIGEPIEYTGVRMAGDPAEILGVGDDQEALEEFRRNMEAVRRAEAAVYNDAHSFSQREG